MEMENPQTTQSNSKSMTSPKIAAAFNVGDFTEQTLMPKALGLKITLFDAF